MAKKQQGMSAGTVAAIGAGVAALSAAGYLLFGPEGKKHRKDLKSWMVKMKAEVMEKMEKAKELSAPVYEAIVAEVAQKYKDLKNVDPEDLAKEIAALKKNWKSYHAGKTGGKKKKAPAKKSKPAARKRS